MELLNDKPNDVELELLFNFFKYKKCFYKLQFL